MTTPLYASYQQKFLNKENLINNEGFIKDASEFLIKRENKKASELQNNEDVYDAFLEHFRQQNVNEITALKDLNYANRANDEEKKQFGRLMDTFDKMDTKLGTKGLLDYAEGVFKAPSTYAGIFSFGAGKAGALAANQGVKLTIKNVLKKPFRKQIGKSFIAGSAVEAPGAATTVYAQEKTRVETGIKDEVDLKSVGIATGVSSLTGGVLTSLTGIQRGITSNKAQFLVNKNIKVRENIIKNTYKKTTKEVFKNPKTDLAKIAMKFEDDLNKSIRAIEETTKGKRTKLPLKETLGEETLEKGKRVKTQNILTPDEMEIKNLAAFASEITTEVKTKVKKGKKFEERFTSTLVRGLQTLQEGDDLILNDKFLTKMYDKYKLTIDDLAPLLAYEASQAGSLLGTIGGLARRQKFNSLIKDLNALDEAAKNQGISLTASINAGKRELEETYGKEFLGRFGRGVRNLSKARVGLMTIQAATTVRNTTNGYMRNYIYAMDNLGTGITNVVKGLGKGIYAKFTNNATATQEAKAAVALARAQGRNFFDSVFLKDLTLGMTNSNTQALFRLLAEGPQKLGSKNKEIVSQLLRGMGDLGNITGQEKGLVGVARFFNTFNTMSDNMFKRAIFARELDKSIRANPQMYKFKYTPADTVDKTLPKNVEIDSDGNAIAKNLDELISLGRYDLIDSEHAANAMREALEFTYQTGDFAARSGVANRLFQGVINIGQNPLGATVIPFPRYLVNQLRFWYSHTPVVGLLNIGGMLNGTGRKVGKKSAIDFTPEALGKQLAGISLLGALYGIRIQFGDETTGPYEYKDPTTGGRVDARAMLGPFTLHALVADILYRGFPEIHGNEKVSNVKPYKTRELVEAGLGGLGRGGTGLWVVDSFANAFSTEDPVAELKAKEIATKYIANVTNTFMVGGGMLKDVMQQVDDDYIEIPISTVKVDEPVDFFKYWLRASLRSLPAKVSEDRPQVAVPTRDTGLRAFNPIIKQFTGFTPKEPRTLVEEELSRLRFDFIETSPKKINFDGPATNRMRQKMGEHFNKEIFDFIKFDREYQNANDILKRYKLKALITFYKSKVREEQLNPENAETIDEYLDVLRDKFTEKGVTDRKNLQNLFEQNFQTDEKLTEGDNIKNLPDLEKELKRQKSFIKAFK